MNWRMKGVSSYLLVLTTVALGASAQTWRYSVLDLGSGTTASGLNDFGQVIGSGSGFSFRTAPNTPIDVATDTLGDFLPTGINNLGQVTGYKDLGNSSFNVYRTAPNRPLDETTDLVAARTYAATASGINNSGQVIGSAYLSNWGIIGFRTGPNMPLQAADALSIGPVLTDAKGINDLGQVVGSYINAAPDVKHYHAYRTAPNAALTGDDDLDTLGGSDSFAFGINSVGQVVGRSYLSGDLAQHAFRTAPNSGINPVTDDLGVLPGATSSEAVAINNRGVVVGTSGNPFVWTPSGGMKDLSSLLTTSSGAWSLSKVAGINLAGQIAATGTNKAGQPHALVLTPIPQQPRDYVPPAQTLPNMQAEISKRIGKWDGSTFVQLGTNDIAANQKVYVIAHGWGPEMRSTMDANPGAKAWEVHIDNDPSKPVWGQWMEDQAAAIHKIDPGATVLAYSWLDHSATTDIHESNISRQEADWAGYRLGNILNQALGVSYSGEVDLIGHSHGARVVSDAALLLNRGHVGRLTLLDSPDRTDLKGDAAVLFVTGEGRNYLDDVLNKLEARNDGKGIGTGADQIFVENYYSITGRAYGENGIINAKLQGNSQQQDVFSLHAYPYTWYTGTGYAGQSGGLEWQPGKLPSQHYWKQDWWTDTGLVDQNGHVYSDDPTRQYKLVVDQASEEHYYPRTPRMIIYNREGSVAGSTPAAMLRMEEHSPAYADFTMETSAGDNFLTFDYQFENPGDGDQLGIWINGDLKFILTGWDAPSGLQSGVIDIGDLEPGVQLVTVALHNYGDANAVIDVGDFQIVAVPEPGLLDVLALCAAATLRRRRRA